VIPPCKPSTSGLAHTYPPDRPLSQSLFIAEASPHTSQHAVGQNRTSCPTDKYLAPAELALPLLIDLTECRAAHSPRTAVRPGEPSNQFFQSVHVSHVRNPATSKGKEAKTLHHVTGIAHTTARSGFAKTDWTWEDGIARAPRTVRSSVFH
jgi:hypothetical protein